MTSDTSVTDLFPLPSSPPSKLIPKVWVGPNPESIAALREVLKDNHTRWHIFFNDSGFHNHASHRAIANWALGATADVIRAGYQLDCSYQRPAFDSPTIITSENFKVHLGDKQYYAAYLAFFTYNIRQQGIAAAVEQFIFSKDVNHASEGRQPDMFGRFLGGLFHPMIHIGYGFEFCLPGMVAEGLAQAAVHRDDASALVPESFFDDYTITPGVEDAMSRLKSLGISSQAPPLSSNGVHVFTILSRILQDPELGGKEEPDKAGVYTPTMITHRTALIKYIKDWHVDPTNPRSVERKIEELSWMNTVIYGIGGWKAGKHFNADFFHMHMVTSSIFLSSYMAFLSPTSRELLLRSYLLVSLAWWVSRGRPDLDIQGFYESTSAYPMPDGPLPTPHKDTLPSADSPKAMTPNPWFPIIETSIVHPDDHLPKIQRTLLHYNSLYGSREAKLPDFRNTELKSAELLDGTLFIRVAGLTAERKGRVREGMEPRGWDRHGFFKLKS